jgi:glucose-1-phosphate thymidylyltransferase
MKAVVLAGGFAKRLYPITEFTPKALLPVVGTPLIKHILDKKEGVKEIDTIYVSVNQRFELHFKRLLSHHVSQKKIKLVSEPTRKEEEKLGAIGALQYLVDTEKIDDDLMVVAGDNLFDFDLREFVRFYHQKNAAVIAFYDIKRLVPEMYGIAVLDKDHKVVDFEEKPKHPKSSIISTACYILPKRSVKRIKEYLDQKNNADALGHFIKWLAKNEAVYGYLLPGKWYDIGNIDDYKQACLEYEEKLLNR